MDRHKEWMCDMMDDTTREVLNTIRKILKDSGDELAHSDLEKLNYCWDIIRDMHKIKLTAKEIEAHEKQGASNGKTA